MKSEYKRFSRAVIGKDEVDLLLGFSTGSGFAEVMRFSLCLWVLIS